jgi:anti-sigma regulatory factor (Ser/Thr protein kinase)
MVGEPVDPPGPQPSTRQASANLRAEPASARQARHFVIATLRRAGCRDEDLLDRLAVVTSELVTNAILHAGTDIEVQVSFERHAISIEVLDGASAQPLRVPRQPDDTGGRGLVLVDALVDEWGVVELGGSDDRAKAKKVWIRVARL